MSASTITNLPIIDYSKITGGTISNTPEAVLASQSEKEKLYKAFAEVGFIYLANHAVPALAEKNLFAHAQRFFALPTSEKAKVETGESKGFRGWFNPSRTSGNSATSDQKETFDVGNDLDLNRPNQWPEGLPELRDDMNLFFDRCCEVQLVLLSALAEYVGVAADFFESKMAARDHFFRIICYPARHRGDTSTRFRATPHTDYGTLTLLFNDDNGGLQVKNSEGEWVDAQPVPGCCIVNVGDLLARWFNDRLKSTEHRVVNPAPTSDDADNEDEMLPPRYSIAWFGQPNRDTIVEPLQPCCSDETPRKYVAVQAGQHVMERLADLQKRGRNREVWTDDMSRKTAVKVN